MRSTLTDEPSRQTLHRRTPRDVDNLIRDVEGLMIPAYLRVVEFPAKIAGKASQLNY